MSIAVHDGSIVMSIPLRIGHNLLQKSDDAPSVIVVSQRGKSIASSKGTNEQMKQVNAPIIL